MLVVGKEANTFSTLHGIANCVKNGTRKIVSFNRCKRLVRCSVVHIYFWSSLRILFTVFLETKTELWKLMWAILGCCIGSSDSPLHLPLLTTVILVGDLYIFPFLLDTSYCKQSYILCPSQDLVEKNLNYPLKTLNRGNEWNEWKTTKEISSR